MTIDDLKVWIDESGLGMVVSTRDANLRMDLCRGMGLDLSKDAKKLRVFLSQKLATRILNNLQDNGQIAICASRPFDNSAVQIKGTFLQSTPLTSQDIEKAKQWAGRYRSEIQTIGVLREAAEGLILTPDLCVEAEIKEIFIQTPGPQAGLQLRNS